MAQLPLENLDLQDLVASRWHNSRFGASYFHFGVFQNHRERFAVCLCMVFFGIHCVCVCFWFVLFVFGVVFYIFSGCLCSCCFFCRSVLMSALGSVSV